MRTFSNYELRINNIISKYRNVLLENNNIVGFGRGRKIINGHFTEKQCLIVYVEKKVAKNMLNSQNIIPRYFNGALTDVVEVGGKAEMFSGERRPAVGGISVGNANNNGGGTITCALSEKKNQKNIYLLGCSHALTRKTPDLLFRGVIGDDIVQPSRVVTETN